MYSYSKAFRQSITWLFGIISVMYSFSASAAIPGVEGTSFDLTAKSSYITTPDGDSILVWGYAEAGKAMQYPGPTLIVNQGDTVTINLSNELSTPVSMVFPGQENVTATGGSAGLLTQESSSATDVVRYSFTATHPGTYMYHSGTNQQLQIEMGLVGAIIVRPSTPKQAYNHADSKYDYEYLLLLTEMDPAIHHKVAAGQPVNNTDFHAVLWFINGRNGPDTLAGNGADAPWLPNQPYSSLVRVHPGDTGLFRVIAAGRDMHPFHTHGNHFKLIGRDGRMLESSPGAGTDLALEDYTLPTTPGATYEFLWSWTGEELGWDIFGTGTGFEHTCVSNDGDAFDDVTKEYCPDHGKPFPVVMPELQDLTFAGFYNGSPFLGAFGDLPPGEGGLNLNGGMFYMWHSHTELELINNDIYPGGMLTMMIVEPPGVPID